MNLSDLKEAEYNPRRISQNAKIGLTASVHEFGDLSGITFNTRTQRLVCGHQRVAVIREKYGNLSIENTDQERGIIKTSTGDAFVVRFVDWDEAKERVANMVANNPELCGVFTPDAHVLAKSISLAERDKFRLDEMLKDIKLPEDFLSAADEKEEAGEEFGNLDPGYADGQEATASGQQEEKALADQLQEKWEVRPGQIWELGRHRIICGSSEEMAVFEALMRGEKADMMFTDPPYGVSYADKNEMLNAIDKGNRVQREIQNDHMTPQQMEHFWRKIFSLCLNYLHGGAAYYVTGPQGGGLLELMMALRDCGYYTLRSHPHQIIWAKNNHVLGRTDYNYKHEPILYGWTEGSHRFYADHDVSLWEIPKPQKSIYHPTMKPVELYERGIRNSTRADDIVLEPFSGSGTCLLACERLQRQCRAIEIDPAYVSVALERWAELTGGIPQLVNG